MRIPGHAILARQWSGATDLPRRDSNAGSDILLAVIGKGARQYAKTLHPVQWKHLLDKAGTRLVFVRQDQKGSSQHFGHAVLRRVKNDETLVIQPDAGHQREEEVPLADTHLWRSKTVHNHMGGIPEPELIRILDEGAKMAMGNDNVEVKETDIVLMDIGDQRFYAGNPRPGKYLWTDKIAEATKYSKQGHAARSVSMLQKNEVAARAMSETGLSVLTVKQVWAVKQKAKDLKYHPRLRRLSEVPEPNHQAAAELFEAASLKNTSTGKPVNVPPLSTSEKKEIAAKKRAEEIAIAMTHASNGNGHHHGEENGNGHANGHGVAHRIAPFMNQQIGFPLASDVPQTAHPLQIDPSIYNMATVPVAIANADKEVDQAWRDFQDAQQMMSEALARYHAAQQKRQALTLQIQPQLMVQAVKAEAMQAMREGQEKLIKMLADVAAGKLPTVEDMPESTDAAPDTSGSTEGAGVASLLTTT